MEMGFPRPRCEKAAVKTGNTSADDAMNWLFAHMEDPDIDEPLAPSGGSKGGDSVPQDLIDTVMSMGFSNAQAKKALKETVRGPFLLETINSNSRGTMLKGRLTGYSVTQMPTLASLPASPTSRTMTVYVPLVMDRK